MPLEKSGTIGKLNVAMYICLRTTHWTLLLTLKGNLWALLNRHEAAAQGQPAIQAADRLPRRVPVKYNSGLNRATPFMIVDIPTAKAAAYHLIEAHLKGGPLRQLLERYKKNDENPLNWFLKCDDIYFGGTDLSRIEVPPEEQAFKDSMYHPTMEGIATFYARDLLLKDEYVAAIRNNEGPLPVAQQWPVSEPGGRYIGG